LRIYLIIFFLLTIIPLSKALAQSDNGYLVYSSASEGLTNAENLYKTTIGRNSRIFTGSYYYDKNYLGIGGHPFFLNNYWNEGTVTYEGQQYDSISFRYDIYRDLLLIKYIDKNGYVAPIQLQSSKVAEFRVMGHHFIRIKEDTLSGIKTGFLDLLYNGQIAKVLAKRRKEVSRTQIGDNMVKGYFVNDKFYIKKDQNYYIVKGKKSLLEVLSDKKDEIKAFLKANKALFKDDHERRLVDTVEYYTSIVNN
jgi:hypothetical protein